MRVAFGWAVLAALWLVPGTAAAQGGDGDTVKGLELKRFQMMEKNDLAALDALLADDLIYSHSSGQVDTKPQFLEALRSGRTRYLKVVLEDTSVRLFDDVALVRGRGQFTVKTQAGQVDNTLAFLDVWVKRNGTWQMVAWQSARLPPPAPQ